MQSNVTLGTHIKACVCQLARYTQISECMLSLTMNKFTNTIRINFLYSELERLVVLRIIRPDKMIFAVRAFVARNLGEQFVHVPAFDLSVCFKESDKIKPLILVLFPGCDPLCSVFNFRPRKEEDQPKNIKILSLGM